MRDQASDQMAAKEEDRMSIRPARGVCLVRRAETEETIPGGKIFLPADTRQKMAAYQIEVIAVGPPDICENDSCLRDHDEAWGSSPGGSPALKYRAHKVPEFLEPGAWAIVRPRSFVPASHEDPGLFFVRHDDVFAILLPEQLPKD